MLAHDFAPKGKPSPFAERGDVEEAQGDESVKVNLFCPDEASLFQMPFKNFSKTLGLCVFNFVKNWQLLMPTDVSVTRVGGSDEPNFSLATNLQRQGNSEWCNGFHRPNGSAHQTAVEFMDDGCEHETVNEHDQSHTLTLKNFADEFLPRTSTSNLVDFQEVGSSLCWDRYAGDDDDYVALLR